MSLAKEIICGINHRRSLYHQRPHQRLSHRQNDIRDDDSHLAICLSVHLSISLSLSINRFKDCRCFYICSAFHASFDPFFCFAICLSAYSSAFIYSFACFSAASVFSFLPVLLCLLWPFFCFFFLVFGIFPQLVGITAP